MEQKGSRSGRCGGCGYTQMHVAIPDRTERKKRLLKKLDVRSCEDSTKDSSEKASIQTPIVHWNIENVEENTLKERERGKCRNSALEQQENNNVLRKLITFRTKSWYGFKLLPKYKFRTECLRNSWRWKRAMTRSIALRLVSRPLYQSSRWSEQEDQLREQVLKGMRFICKSKNNQEKN